MSGPSVTIVLDDEEMEHTAVVAVRRQMNKIRLNRPNRDGETDEGKWDRDVEGAGAEEAFSKWKNLHWSGAYGAMFASGDVGAIEIRQTAWPNGALMVRQHQAGGDRIYVLATGRIPTFNFRGWAYGDEVKVPDHWADPTHRQRWAFFMPQKNLRPLETLDEAILHAAGKRRLA